MAKSDGVVSVIDYDQVEDVVFLSYSDGKEIHTRQMTMDSLRIAMNKIKDSRSFINTVMAKSRIDGELLQSVYDKGGAEWIESEIDKIQLERTNAGL